MGCQRSYKLHARSPHMGLIFCRKTQNKTHKLGGSVDIPVWSSDQPCLASPGRVRFQAASMERVLWFVPSNRNRQEDLDDGMCDMCKTGVADEKHYRPILDCSFFNEKRNKQIRNIFFSNKRFLGLNIVTVNQHIEVIRRLGQFVDYVLC